MQWLEANGARFRYDHRRRSAGTIVFLHEMGGTLESYDALVEKIGGRWSMLRYDQRGAGFSSRFSGPLSVDGPAGDLEALLDALSIDKPVAVVGAAVGAAVAIRFATRCPARTSALVLLAPSTCLLPERRTATLEKIARLEREALLADGGGEPTSFDAGPPPRDAASYAATWRMLAELDLEADLASIACPTLVVAGLNDVDRPSAHVAEVAGKIPGARLATLGAGHVMAVDAPDLVAATLTAFLDGAGFK
ncbi:alpha/beta fold hydrolase [Arvimicrobium flavum]|uniref:alpha/beta fold hydrolase n=1 Tax=Arvimicrobium flavum TaxID=3393320 RepID=UPI00237BBDDE|nr:alpha/beta fold hydrolase [Mesorhizobium shangrilense]